MDVEKSSASKPSTDVQMDVDNFQLQETPSPRNLLKAESIAKQPDQKGDGAKDAMPVEPKTTVISENVKSTPDKVEAAPVATELDASAASPKMPAPKPTKVAPSPRKAKLAASPKKAKEPKRASTSPKKKAPESPKKAKSAQKKVKTKQQKQDKVAEKDKSSDKCASGKKRRASISRKRSRSNSTLNTPNSSRNSTPSKKRKRANESAQGTPKGILKKRDTPPKCTTEEVKHSVERKRSLETLIESPALFDREYIRKATKDELLTACGPAGLLPKHSERTCKNLRTALETTRQEIIKNIELDKPVLLLKNMGKHTFYRVSVHKVESPGGGEVDASRQFELRCEWGATGMKKPAKFESDTSLKLQAPKTLTQSKFFATKEEAWNEARKIIEAKDKKRGYYVSMADNLAGVDEHKQVEVSERKINFAKKAIVQPFYGSEKPKKATKLRTSTAPAKK